VSLARDVAKELAKQQRRRRVLFAAVIAALIAAAVMYLHCGAGWGFGGSGNGSGKASGSGSAKQAVKAPESCEVKLDAGGLKVDGAAAALDQVVAACKKAGRAEVVVTNSAREGDRAALRDALDEAGVPHGTF
jgi:hypothetical protein